MTASENEPPRLGRARWQFGLKTLFVLVLLCSLPFGAWKCLLEPGVQDMRDGRCHSYLFKIGHALRTYHISHGSFPPAYVADENGKPMHSWRTLILPHMMTIGNSEDVYNRYGFSEPWDGPNNRKLVRELERNAFACPRGPERGTTYTSYVAIVGPNTAWPGAKATSFDAKVLWDDSSTSSPYDDAKAAADTILVIEITGSDIHWMEPRDITLDELLSDDPSRSGSRLSSPHPVKIRYITVGREFGSLEGDVSVEELRRLATLPEKE